MCWSHTGSPCSGMPMEPHGCGMCPLASLCMHPALGSMVVPFHTCTGCPQTGKCINTPSYLHTYHLNWVTSACSQHGSPIAQTLSPPVKRNLGMRPLVGHTCVPSTQSSMSRLALYQAFPDCSSPLGQRMVSS